MRRLISIVIPCFNESAVFPHLRAELGPFCDHLAQRHDVEIIVVDDGSRDDTWRQIESLARDDARVRAVSFSRNFGHQAALTCGYDHARGDAVVCVDADLQDPLAVIERMVDAWEGGADVVFGVRASREGETRFKLASAALFYRFLRWIGARHVRLDSGDFRLLSRRALIAFREMREYHRFVRGMVGWLGFVTAEVRYERKARRAGETKYPLRKMIRLAADAAISSSFMPLRLAYALAMMISAGILGYLVFTFFGALFLGTPLVPGWTSLMLAIVGFGAANLVALGIIGEYVGRIYEQAKGRPLYVVKETVEAGNAREESSAA